MSIALRVLLAGILLGCTGLDSLAAPKDDLLSIAGNPEADLAKPQEPGKPNLLNIDDKVKEYLSDPTTQESINRVIKSQIGRIPLLSGLDLKLKTISQEDDETTLGFEYSYEKIVREREIESASRKNRANYLQVDFTGSSRGTVAFDHPENPADFLDTNVSFGLYWSHGGVRRALTPAERDRFLGLMEQIADIPDDDGKLLAHPQVKEFLSIARSTLSNQFALDFRGKAGLESDQTFATRQLVYGGQLGLVLTGWEKFDARTWEATSLLAKVNVIDYPFALVRWVTGFDDGFAPRGLSIPAGRVGLALVDPENDDPRAKVGDGSSFPRFDAEVSFRTPLFAIEPLDPELFGGASSILSTIGEFYFAANYRYYKEIDASAEVRQAELDEFGYVALTLGTTSGAFFSWANGKLPFDAADDNVFEVGYKFHF